MKIREQIIKELKETSYWKLIDREDTLLALFIGSELIGFRDDDSDYDILCITKNKYTEARRHLKWNGVIIHLMFVDLDSFLNIKDHLYLPLGQMQALEKNNTVFLNNDSSTLEYLISNSNMLLDQSFRQMIKKSMYRIDRIIETNSIEKDKVKLLHHLIYQKYTLFKKPIDAEYLISIKRIDSRPVRQKYIDMFIQDLKEIKEWYEKVNY